MVTKTDIVTLHRLRPLLTAQQLADELRCKVEQIRMIAQRCCLKIPKVARRVQRPNSLLALGREARRAGLTVAAIQQIGAMQFRKRAA